MYSNDEIEKQIQEKGLNAPRVTLDMIEAAIRHVEYHSVTSHSGSIITLCVITLQNGFTTTGLNHGPVSLENFNQELANQLAYGKAYDQIWPLEGYRLKQTLHDIATAELAGGHEPTPAA